MLTLPLSRQACSLYHSLGKHAHFATPIQFYFEDMKEKKPNLCINKFTLKWFFSDKLEAPRSLYSSPGYNNMSKKLDNFGQKITNVDLVIADLLSKKIWAGVPPLM
jgi:hypothetical protein